MEPLAVERSSLRTTRKGGKAPDYPPHSTPPEVQSSPTN
jgi:hypothetical protein